MENVYKVTVNKLLYKESYFVNGYAEIDLENIKKVNKHRNLFIVIESKKEIEETASAFS